MPISKSRFTNAVVAIAATLALAAPSREAAAPQNGVHPIVDAQSGMLFGGTIDGKWTGPGPLAPRLQSGERYRLYSLTRALGIATGGKPEPGGVPCPDEPSLSLHPNPSGTIIGIGGSWNALPRPVRREDIHQLVYQRAARAILDNTGLRRARVNITQILRVDLDGDGQEEVLICASNPTHQGTPQAKRGDYSFVALHKVVGGKVKTVLLEQEFHVKDCPQCVPSTFHIVGVWDVNGDGRMEVVTGGQYYEGEWETIYEIHGLKARPVLKWACGA